MTKLSIVVLKDDPMKPVNRYKDVINYSEVKPRNFLVLNVTLHRCHAYRRCEGYQVIIQVLQISTTALPHPLQYPTVRGESRRPIIRRIREYSNCTPNVHGPVFQSTLEHRPIRGLTHKYLSLRKFLFGVLLVEPEMLHE